MLPHSKTEVVTGSQVGGKQGILEDSRAKDIRGLQLALKGFQRLERILRDSEGFKGILKG